MDMFKSALGGQSAPTNQPQQTGPGNLPINQQVNQTGTNGNTTIPASTDTSDKTVTADNPLDAFKDIWTADTNTKNEEPLFNIDDRALSAAAANTNFSGVVTPELMTRIAAGGEDGMKAMMEGMNKMSQATYAQSARATAGIVEAALAKQAKAFEAKLPDIIKGQSVSESLRESNPIFNHPAAAPMLDVLQQQLRVKNPTATQTELKDMAQKFLVSFAQAGNPTKPVNTTVNKSEDWGSFLD